MEGFLFFFGVILFPVTNYPIVGTYVFFVLLFFFIFQFIFWWRRFQIPVINPLWGYCKETIGKEAIRRLSILGPIFLGFILLAQLIRLIVLMVTTFPWWSYIIVGGVLTIALAVVAIIFMKKQRY